MKQGFSTRVEFFFDVCPIMLDKTLLRLELQHFAHKDMSQQTYRDNENKVKKLRYICKAIYA